ncbi:MAG: hypothetical protein IT353_19255, partial [Gemmatimonadaceae bacterium]|nr:hypothetical protein [Gemmatimonadaceae bacterium]
MLIRLEYGPRRGDVVDFADIASARAMLADGRASLPDEAAPVVGVSDRESVVIQKVKQ